MDLYKIHKIINELFSPSNIEEYNEILNKDFTDEENELIDAYIKFWHWELDEENKNEDKEEDKSKIVGIHFEYPKVDISKYEWKPNKEDKND